MKNQQLHEFHLEIFLVLHIILYVHFLIHQRTFQKLLHKCLILGNLDPMTLISKPLPRFLHLETGNGLCVPMSSLQSQDLRANPHRAPQLLPHEVSHCRLFVIYARHWNFGLPIS
ncbi:hypothetical protein BDQ12DRAFT_676601 [Crucibulum laeve]|uniref:Uncharacterized protein n=1 Tax=Crucibulum laeve TaxID=68775 RepID=A0A5C3MFM3_9AGAR|nr:hypothetical protein BDQ12DRAFT_676601 [Crucibulum laeve]